MMETRKIPLALLVQNTGQIQGVPTNPREWNGDELERLEVSIKETPELLEARGLIVYPYGEQYVIIGGNMRWTALKELGETEAPCIVLPKDTPVETLRQMVIKDNVTLGNWNMLALRDGWEAKELKGWGAPAGAVRDMLPDELEGVTLAPDDLPDIEGDDQREYENLTITYTEETEAKVCELLGVEALEKVVYNLDELV